MKLTVRSWVFGSTGMPLAHPYVQAYPPVNRLLDGTLHDW